MGQIVCPLYGISLFLPTIIKSLNYSKTEAQLMTVPIYITAAILAVIVAFCSDRVGKRSPFVIAPMCMMLVGFTMFVYLNFEDFGTVWKLFANSVQVHCVWQPKGRVWRRIHRGLRHLSCIPWCYRLAIKQFVGQLQAECWHGAADWYRQSWWCKY